MSDSVRPHRRKPTRLPRPWVSPGKNTGVGYHFLLQCMKVKSESEVAQSCLTLSDPMDCSLSGSSTHGIFQARGLEWGAIFFSNAWKWKVKVNSLSHVRLLATPWIKWLGEIKTFILWCLWLTAQGNPTMCSYTRAVIYIICREFFGGPMVKNLPFNAEDKEGGKMLRGNYDPTCCGASKPLHHNYCQWKALHDTTKTQCSQIIH